jgi:lipoate-protein ligase A
MNDADVDAGFSTDRGSARPDEDVEPGERSGPGPLADREWRLVPDEARPGPVQMALDEVAAETAAAGGPRTVRVYSWAPSCLSLGYGQEPDTVDWDACERRGVDVTRRQTGGGGIYHDARGDVSYSLAAPRAELPGDLVDAYHVLCEPLLRALSRLGVPAGYADRELPAIYEPACYLRGLHPAHDVVAFEDDAGDGDRGADVDGEGDASDGGRVRKLSGNAQYRRRDAVVQHGSLTYEARPGAHLAVFADPGVGPAAFSERVAGVAEFADVTRADVVDALEAAFAEWADATVGSWTDDELARARERASEKYEREEWVRRRAGER